MANQECQEDVQIIPSGFRCVKLFLTIILILELTACIFFAYRDVATANTSQTIVDALLIIYTMIGLYAIMTENFATTVVYLCLSLFVTGYTIYLALYSQDGWIALLLKTFVTVVTLRYGMMLNEAQCNRKLKMNKEECTISGVYGAKPEPSQVQVNVGNPNTCLNHHTTSAPFPVLPIVNPAFFY